MCAASPPVCSPGGVIANDLQSMDFSSLNLNLNLPWHVIRILCPFLDAGNGVAGEAGEEEAPATAPGGGEDFSFMTSAPTHRARQPTPGAAVGGAPL